MLGVLFFSYMFDWKLVQPTYFEWLLRLDPATQFIGWHFFRHEPWHLPLGAALDYGIEMASSIVYTDSIPLFAIAFKTLDEVLPDKFQYIGLWILFCYVLQGLAAWLLSGLYTREMLQRTLMTAFFVISPIMLDRAIGHYALMAHWLILFALYLYLKPDDGQDTLAWAVLVSVSALVQAYLLYMVLAVWAAYIVRRTIVDNEMNAWVATRSATIVWASLLSTMWLAGYFTIPVGAFAGGASYYGTFAANLNALWNPGWAANFLPALPVRNQNVEGYDYLGAGVLAMLALVMAILLVRHRARVGLRSLLPLICVAAILWLMALSNQIAWGDKLVLTVPLPERLLGMLSMVRASGRLLWVAYYGLTLLAVAVAVRHLPRQAGTLFLIAGLSVQIADLSIRYVNEKEYFREHFIVEPAHWTSPLRSPFWSAAAKHYRDIRFVPVTETPKDYAVFALFAADHRMRINVGYFARIAVQRVVAANDELLRSLEYGDLRSDSLYIPWTPSTPLKYRLGSLDGIGTVDGFSVIAPRWFEFADCCGELRGILKRGAER